MQLLRDLEAQARERLPPAAYDYFAGGAGDERTLEENVSAWRRHWLVPRQLTGAGAPDLTTDLLGYRAAAPIILAPAAAQRLLHPDGEPGVARAAAAQRLVSCLSTRATADLEEVAAAAPDGRRWFQLYVDPDRTVAERQLERAAAHGYTQVVLTIDLPVAGRRDREVRNGPVPLPDGVSLTTHLGHAHAAEAKPQVGGWAELTWEDVEWAAEASGLPVICKGVLSAHDAELAIARGASAVIVSNHGARQLDGVVPTAVALPDVVDAVDGRVPVYVDGGIRSGSDVATALALGAQAVLVGRPYLWGLAAGGTQGVADVLTALVDDTARTLALLGARTPSEVGPHHLKRA